MDEQQPEPVQRVFRRTFTWRVFHWSNVVSIVGCAITGIFIANPFLVAHVKYLMAWTRAIHLYFATVLDVAVIGLAYLYVFSRAEQSIEQLRPTRSNLHAAQEAFLNFVLLNRRKRFDSSRPDPFNALLFVILHILVVVQMITGLQLYVQHFTSGASAIGRWWPSLLHTSTDWTLSLFGGPMGVRTAHLITMYIIIGWALCHIYYEVWRTIAWNEGDIGIAFGGYKFARLQEDKPPAEHHPPGASATTETST
jgi:Ni/Fe-hydrogenase 1 B-type cytochrome subunit